ncbi:MAG: L,D-transpeptidase [Pseudomonadota bacterium]
MFKNFLRLTRLTIAGAVALGVFSVSGDAYANSRYAEPPPVVLSPDLTEPWQLQLTSKKRAKVVTRSSKSYATLQKKKRKAAKKAAKRKKKRLFQTASLQTGSALRSTTRRSSSRTTQVRRTAPQSLAPQFLPQIVEYNTKHAPGTIIVDTKTKFLYLVMANGEARRYGVGVGKPGFEWAGTHRVTRKAEWPSWRPPETMIRREAAKGRILPRFMPGGPKNPMGARALYLGSTLYRIHGTNSPHTIGTAVSSGCIRMRNQDVVDLYQRVPVGAKVIVI